MFFLKAIGCRLFQLAFRLALPLLPYREPQIIPTCAALGTFLSEKSIDGALIVTDAGIVQNGLCTVLENALRDNGIRYTVYDRTQPNPTVDNVEEARSVYIEHRCDTLIAIGGGSAMDCAKAVGARIAYPKRSLRSLGGLLRILRPLPMLIAIPTTAGTGSETTPAALITDTKKHDKYAMMSFPLIPHCAVLDASLTRSLPPHLTAATGMDALTHAVEAYIGHTTTAETRALSESAVALIFANIERAHTDGGNLTARQAMLDAAYMAGAAFSKSYVGYIHAAAHALGGFYGTPHGLANAVIMPYVLDMYGAAVHKKLHRLGIAAGVCTACDTPADGARAFIAAIRDLNRHMGIPTTLAGIREDDIIPLAKHTEREANPLYPVPKLMTANELESIFKIIGEPVI